jgi:hypothetical protein
MLASIRSLSPQRFAGCGNTPRKSGNQVADLGELTSGRDGVRLGRQPGRRPGDPTIEVYAEQSVVGLGVGAVPSEVPGQDMPATPLVTQEMQGL